MRKILPLLCLLLLLGTLAMGTALNTTSISAAESDVFRLVSQIGGSFTVHTASGNWIFAGIGARLAVFDISTPSSPRQAALSDLLDDLISGIAVANDYAYVLTQRGTLYVFDVAFPSIPRLRSVVSVAPNELFSSTLARDIKVTGNTVVILCTHIQGGDYSDVVEILDITVRDHPVQRAALYSPFTALDHFNALDVQGQMMYLAGDWGIEIYSIASLPNIIRLGSYPSAQVQSLASTGGRIFAIISEGAGWFALRIIDASDPSHPRLAQTFSINSLRPPSLALSGERLYVNALQQSGGVLYIFDIRTSLVYIIQTVSGTFFSQNLLVQDYIAQVLLSTSLELYNLSNPALGVPRLAAYRLQTGFESVRSLVSSGGRLYADRAALDLRDPLHPVKLGACSAAGQPKAAYGRFLYFLDEHRFSICDYTAPANPVLVSTFEFPESAFDAAVDAAGAYISYSLSEGNEWHYGLLVLDISSPTNPRQVTKYDYLGSYMEQARNVATNGRKVFLVVDQVASSDHWSEIFVFPAIGTGAQAPSYRDIGQNVSIARADLYINDIVASPEFVFWTLSDYGSDIHFQNVYGALVENFSGDYGGLVIGNFANSVSELVVSGNRLVLSDYLFRPQAYAPSDSSNVYIWDISDFRNGRASSLGIIPIPDGAYDVAYVNGYLYVAAGSAGLLVFLDTSFVQPTPTPTATATPTGTRIPSPPTPACAGGVLQVLQEGYNGYHGTTDTSILAWEPSRNFGDDIWIRVRSGEWESGLLRFEIAPPASGWRVDSALLALYVDDRSNTNAATYEMYELLRTWDEHSATWLLARSGDPWGLPGANLVGTDRGNALLGSGPLNATGLWLSWDVSLLAKKWASDPATNYGLIIIGKGAAGVEYRFASKEHTSPRLRPHLALCLRAGTTTPTPTPSPTRTPTITPSPSSTPTVTMTSTPVQTPTPTPELGGDLILSGRVFDASDPGNPPISAAHVRASMTCIGRSFETYTNLAGSYSLLIPSLYANACPDITMRVAASGYQTLVQEFPVSFLRANPILNFGLLPRQAVLPLVLKFTSGYP